VGKPYGQIVAFAPRSDLPTIEGTIVEDMTAPYFAEFTGFCDTGGSNTHVESMFSFGLGLNQGANGLGTGPTAGLYGFVSTKFNDLTAMIQDAAAQITPATVTTTLENYVTQSQTYFNNDYQHDVNDYSCALNSIASADVYLRNEANQTNPSVFRYTAPAGGNNNPNPAGEIDARLANLYLSISGDFLYTPNRTWPTTNVPPCVTLSVTATTVPVGGSATLNFGPPTPQFASTPLLYSPTQCTLSASDGKYATPVTFSSTSGSVSTGTLTKSGTYTATLECAGATGDASSSFATTSITVSSGPTLKSITVGPNQASIAAGTTQQFTATGNYSSGPSQTLSSVTWSSGSTNVATIGATSGVAQCLKMGSAQITATSGTVSGSTTLTCTAAVLSAVTVSPATATIPAGTMQQFTASGTNSLGQATPLSAVTWNSLNTAVATINSSSGLATCVQAGNSTTITATSGGIVGSANLTCGAATLVSIAVTPAPASIPVGGTQQFTATGTDTLGSMTSLTSPTVTWNTSNPGTASISSTGLATCLTAGNPTTITATSGGITSNSAVLTCLSGSIALSANPTTTMINNNVTLTWTSANLPAGEACVLSSNSSDAPLNQTGEPTSGSLSTTEAVPQNVTYTISCSGPVTVSSSVSVLYTLVTTYQYTGKQFTDAYGPYTTSDRVIASLTVSVPFGPNASTGEENPVIPGLVLTLSDGLQTLSTQSGASSFTIVTTDANGAINSWSLTDSQHGDQIFTQNYSAYGSALDLGSQGQGPFCNSTQICAANPYLGSWTSTNVNSLHVMVGTTSGTNPATGQLYQIIVGSSDSGPTLDASTILSETPEPATCLTAAGPTASGLAAAITGLAFVPNATSGFSDLVAANGNAGDVFLLSGPSYQPTADINSASANCWNTGPAGISVAADASGDVVGAGHDVHNSQTPALYYFPPTPTNGKPNFVLMDNVNSDPSLTSCNMATSVGCVGTLVDTVVAQSTIQGSPVAAGDMLVLVGDAYSGNSNGNPIVLRFPAASIQSAKAYASNCLNSFGDTSGAPPPCVGNSGGSQLVTQTTLASFLSQGEAPVSMDISPLDGSLFIATSKGNIYQLSATPTGYVNPTQYASNQPGMQQLRVGQSNNTLYVFATVPGGDSAVIVMYVGAAPTGGFQPFASGVTYTSVNGSPSGLAVH
jgi:hypothetical protein